MKRLKIFFFLIATTLTRGLNAQTLGGSTTIDIDPSTNIITATCETVEDDGDYEADVQCSIYDSSGNRLAAQGYIDHSGQGYAQVVLTIQGQAGTTYTATSQHIAISNITDLPSGPGKPTLYEDYYNYSSFEQGGTVTYPDSYAWEGPGPDVQIRNKVITVGDTTATVSGTPLPLLAPTCTVSGSLFTLEASWGFFGGCVLSDYKRFPTSAGGSCGSNQCYQVPIDATHYSQTCASGPRYANTACTKFVDNGFPFSIVTIGP